MNGIRGIGYDPRIYGLGTTPAAPAASAFKVYGAGSTISKNVFKVLFTEALTAVPQIRVYDRSVSFPASGDLTSSDYGIFSGSSYNEFKPMMALIDTTRNSTPSTNWYSLATIKVGAATCLVKGDSSYFKFNYSPGSMIANASLYFNMQMGIPNDINPTIQSDHDIAIRYMYSGDTPDVLVYGNSETNGGNDSVPYWELIIEDSFGIKFGDSSSSTLNVSLTIPLSGMEKTETIFVVGS